MIISCKELLGTTFAASLAVIKMPRPKGAGKAFVIVMAIAVAGCTQDANRTSFEETAWTEILARNAAIGSMALVHGELIWTEWSGSAENLQASVYALGDTPSADPVLIKSADNIDGPMECGGYVLFIAEDLQIQESRAYSWEPGTSLNQISGGGRLRSCGADWQAFDRRLGPTDPTHLEIERKGKSPLSFRDDETSFLANIGAIGGIPHSARIAWDGTTTIARIDLQDGTEIPVAHVDAIVEAFSGNENAMSFLGGQAGENSAMHALHWPTGSPRKLNQHGEHIPIALETENGIFYYGELAEGLSKRIGFFNPNTNESRSWDIPFPGRSHASLAIFGSEAIYVSLVVGDSSAAKSTIYALKPG